MFKGKPFVEEKTQPRTKIDMSVLLFLKAIVVSKFKNNGIVKLLVL